MNKEELKNLQKEFDEAFKFGGVNGQEAKDAIDPEIKKGLDKRLDALFGKKEEKKTSGEDVSASNLVGVTTEQHSPQEEQNREM
ncbi:hypothetical protein [Wolbachia endosymbiont of Ctenocephalides felis wCfeT]|uniref:hypothetical protein n=1 Tax=Wolbachia endosymbiont of Ctenocephalides felis wCfeT TaxID=2732593 RepID=UPI001445D56B|nr:hypothetical protein [Wolbachia endosymbiont of Ctenocephalides felis wCfeT]